MCMHGLWDGTVHTVQRETFEGEKFHEFCSVRNTYERVLHEIWAYLTHLIRLIQYSTNCSLSNGPVKFSPLSVSCYVDAYS